MRIARPPLLSLAAERPSHGLGVLRRSASVTQAGFKLAASGIQLAQQRRLPVTKMRASDSPSPSPSQAWPAVRARVSRPGSRWQGPGLTVSGSSLRVRLSIHASASQSAGGGPGSETVTIIIIMMTRTRIELSLSELQAWSESQVTRCQ